MIIIKNRGISYPAQFPTYTIGDGKILVDDVRERFGLMMALSDRKTRRIKLFYKGRLLNDPGTPVREYGVKHKSEIIAVVREGGDASSSSDKEETVISDSEQLTPLQKIEKAQAMLKRRFDRRPNAESTSRSPNNFLNTAAQSSAGAGSEAFKKLDKLSTDFRNNWKPLCDQFISTPPPDEKSREDEHRRLKESVFQHILLKVDGIGTDGIPEVRMRRKELVKEVQEILKGLDEAKGRPRETS